MHRIKEQTKDGRDITWMPKLKDQQFIRVVHIYDRNVRPIAELETLYFASLTDVNVYIDKRFDDCEWKGDLDDFEVKATETDEDGTHSVLITIRAVGLIEYEARITPVNVKLEGGRLMIRDNEGKLLTFIAAHRRDIVASILKYLEIHDLTVDAESIESLPWLSARRSITP